MSWNGISEIKNASLNAYHNNSRKFDFSKLRNSSTKDSGNSKVMLRCNAYLARKEMQNIQQKEGFSTGQTGTYSMSRTGRNMPMHRNTMILLNVRGSSFMEAFVQNRMVLPEASCRRKVWNVCLFVCLAYTGIVLPYRLSFIENAIPHVESDEDGFFEWIETVLDVFFFCDFFVCFFITYRDHKDREVLDIRKIVRRYLRTYAIINLIALIPPKLARYLINPSSTSASATYHKALRFLRLQRMSRLARMVSLVKMVRIARLLENFLPLESVQSHRGIRIVNLVGCLLWVAHVAACGWFLVASFHTHPEVDTWVSRRIVSPGVPLHEKQPFEEWLHSMYFVMTVFTTVGFGDISANTTDEIIVVTILMMVGTIANGIVLSEVINIITNVDQKCKQVKEQKELLTDFALHTDLQMEESIFCSLTEWIEQGKANEKVDVKRLSDLLTDQWLPRQVTDDLSKAVFGGALLKNTFCTMSLSQPVPSVSPSVSRFTILVGLAGNIRFFDGKEVVYRTGERDANIYLVLSGIFAAVCRPLPEGGYGDELGFLEDCHDDASIVANTLFCERSYFGDIEPFLPNQKGRVMTTRCESCDGGELFILQKPDWQQLANEFVEALKAWRVAAFRKDRRRRIKEQKFNLQGAYMDVAALTIQRYWQSKRKFESVESHHASERHHASDCGTPNMIFEVWDQNYLGYKLPIEQPTDDARRIQKDVDDVLGDVLSLRGEAANLSDKLTLITRALSQNAVNLKECNWNVHL